MLWMSAYATIRENVAVMERTHARSIRFQTQNAQCFKVEDRDRLLAIIETAFGTFREFDNRVRTSMVRQATLSEMIEVSSSRKLRKAANQGSVNGLNIRDLVEISVVDDRS
jgi:hypothetical protein